MPDRPAPDPARADATRRALTLAILAQAAIALLAGLNVAWDATRTATALGDYVRWRELLSLSALMPASAATLFLGIWILERGRADATGPLLLFAVALCLGGVSMGVHEPLRALPLRAAGKMEPSLRFWIDIHSHAAFFLSYISLCAAMLWSQARNPIAAPRRAPFAMLPFALAGAIAGAGVFFSLVRGGDIRVDLAVIAIVLVIAEILRRGRPFSTLPVHLTLELANAIGLLALLRVRFL